MDYKFEMINATLDVAIGSGIDQIGFDYGIQMIVGLLSLGVFLNKHAITIPNLTAKMIGVIETPQYL